MSSLRRPMEDLKYQSSRSWCDPSDLTSEMRLTRLGSRLRCLAEMKAHAQLPRCHKDSFCSVEKSSSNFGSPLSGGPYRLPPPSMKIHDSGMMCGCARKQTAIVWSRFTAELRGMARITDGVAEQRCAVLAFQGPLT
jgi:hypothetical protein